MSVELIIEVLKTILFFPSLITIDRFLLNTIILFGIYTSLAYLITLFVLQSSAYKSKREFVDSDFRVKLGWSVGLLFSIFILSLNILYIWLKGHFRTPLDILSHWTVIVVIFIIWLVNHSSKRKELKIARKTIQQ